MTTPPAPVETVEINGLIYSLEAAKTAYADALQDALKVCNNSDLIEQVAQLIEDRVTCEVADTITLSSRFHAKVSDRTRAYLCEVNNDSPLARAAALALSRTAVVESVIARAVAESSSDPGSPLTEAINIATRDFLDERITPVIERLSEGNERLREENRHLRGLVPALEFALGSDPVAKIRGFVDEAVAKQLTKGDNPV